MKIAVTAPTGHIGRKLVDRLLDQGHCQVILLCRHPDKVEGAVADGAKVFKGDLRDPHFVEVATKGVDALFWLTPPNDKAEDFDAYQKKLGLNAAQAIRRNRIKRVVNLSALGAQIDKGAGPIAGLHDVEVIIESACQAVACNLTHLRPAFFQENFEVFVPEITRTGTIALPIRADARAPMVSTDDVAEVAAELLLDDSWRGCHVKEVMGPREYSFKEAAKIIGRAVGRPVHFEQVSRGHAKHELQEHGASPDVAENYVEMYEALDQGLVKPSDSGDEAVTAPTELEEFAREKLARGLRDETPTAKTMTGVVARRDVDPSNKSDAVGNNDERRENQAEPGPADDRKAEENRRAGGHAAQQSTAKEVEPRRRAVSEDNPRIAEMRPVQGRPKPGLGRASLDRDADRTQR